MEVQLVVVKGNPRGRTLTFAPGRFLFGRGAECHVRPDSDWVSRQHCLLTVTVDSIHLKDLGSTNGTLVNGHRLMGELPLAHGDTIQLGPLVLQVSLPAHAALLEAVKQTKVPASEVTLVDKDSAAKQFDPGATMEDTLKIKSE